MKRHATEERAVERPHLVDKQIEDREYRESSLTDIGEGLVCISIEAGDELGELYVTMQFEAKPGAHGVCQIGQNRLLIRGAEWLDQILEEISSEEAEWGVAFRPNPCRKATVKMATDLAVDVANRRVNARQAVEELERRSLESGTALRRLASLLAHGGGALAGSDLQDLLHSNPAQFDRIQQQIEAELDPEDPEDADDADDDAEEAVEAAQWLAHYVALGDAAPGRMPEAHALVEGSEELKSSASDLRELIAEFEKAWSEVAPPEPPGKTDPPPPVEQPGPLPHPASWQAFDADPAVGFLASARSTSERRPRERLRAGDWRVRADSSFSEQLSLSSRGGLAALNSLEFVLPGNKAKLYLAVNVERSDVDQHEVWRLEFSLDENSELKSLKLALGTEREETTGWRLLTRDRRVEFLEPPRDEDIYVCIRWAQGQPCRAKLSTRSVQEEH